MLSVSGQERRRPPWAALLLQLLCLMNLLRSNGVNGQVPDKESCLDYNITKGETLKANCEAHCSPLSMEAFDYAAQNEVTPSILDRNTVCRCLNATGGIEFECWNVEPDVWDTSVPPEEDCGEYNITSLSSCEEFCAAIDPLSYQFTGSGDNIECFCATPPVKICGTSGASSLYHAVMLVLATTFLSWVVIV